MLLYKARVSDYGGATTPVVDFLVDRAAGTRVFVHPLVSGRFVFVDDGELDPAVTLDGVAMDREDLPYHERPVWTTGNTSTDWVLFHSRVEGRYILKRPPLAEPVWADNPFTGKYEGDGYFRANLARAFESYSQNQITFGLAAMGAWDASNGADAASAPTAPTLAWSWRVWAKSGTSDFAGYYDWFGTGEPEQRRWVGIPLFRDNRPSPVEWRMHKNSGGAIYFALSDGTVCTSVDGAWTVVDPSADGSWWESDVMPDTGTSSATFVRYERDEHGEAVETGDSFKVSFSRFDAAGSPATVWQTQVAEWL